MLKKFIKENTNISTNTLLKYDRKFHVNYHIPFLQLVTWPSLHRSVNSVRILPPSKHIYANYTFWDRENNPRKSVGIHWKY